MMFQNNIDLEFAFSHLCVLTSNQRGSNLSTDEQEV